MQTEFAKLQQQLASLELRERMSRLDAQLESFEEEERRRDAAHRVAQANMEKARSATNEAAAPLGRETNIDSDSIRPGMAADDWYRAATAIGNALLERGKHLRD